MARSKKPRRSGAADPGDGKNGVEISGAAEHGAAGGEGGGGASSSRGRGRPSWDEAVETGINGYRGSGG
jgi:hypothetical protein